MSDTICNLCKKRIAPIYICECDRKTMTRNSAKFNAELARLRKIKQASIKLVNALAELAAALEEK